MVKLSEVVRNNKVVKTMEVCLSTSVLQPVRLEKASKVKHDSKNKDFDELTIHKRARKETIRNIEKGGRKLEKKKVDYNRHYNNINKGKLFEKKPQ
jgi:hypothetical protein